MNGNGTAAVAAEHDDHAPDETPEARTAKGQFAAALARAQLKIRGARKDKRNPAFASKDKPEGSSYADLEAVWDACHEALNEEGIAILQATRIEEGGTVVLRCKLLHVGGHEERSDWPLRPVQNTPQGLFSAGTYGRRFTLMGLAGVVPKDQDDDGNAASERGPLLDEAAQLARMTACASAAALTAFAETQQAIDSFDALPAAGQERIKAAAKALRAKFTAGYMTPGARSLVEAYDRAADKAAYSAATQAAKDAWSLLTGDERHAINAAADKAKERIAAQKSKASDEPPSDEEIALALTDGLEKCAAVSALQQKWAAVMLGKEWAAAPPAARTLAEDTMRGIEAAIRDSKKGK